MKHFASKISMAVLALTAVAAHAGGLTTGSESATYFAMGTDMKKICAPSVSLQVHPSEGSLANLSRIFKDKDTQYGIIQQDALIYRNLTDAAMMKNIMMLFPLFNEEIHILVNAKSGIKDFKDLQGKKVVIGTEGSGNWVTAQIIKNKTGMNWTDVQMAPKEALFNLAMGESDAMIYVAGAPISALKEMGASAKGKISMIPLRHPSLQNFYVSSDIPGGLYPWQDRSVNTYAVKSVLATFNYKSPAMQDEITKLVTCLVKNLPTLQAEKPYHAKWREVDPLSINSVDWPVHPTAAKLIATYKKQEK